MPGPEQFSRYSDEQLYALARYIYSLEPPANPNTFDSRAARGKQVFEDEGCTTCHRPPLYTNNRLTPAIGFTVPADHREKFDVMSRSVGTDPELALRTRRGTGRQGAVTQRRVVSRHVRPQRVGRHARGLVRSPSTAR